MSNKVSGFVVTLTHNITEEQSQNVMGLLAIIEGVAAVSPVESDLHAEIVAGMRAKNKIVEKLFALISDLNNE